MFNPLIRKLDVGGELNDADRATLHALCEHSRLVEADQDLTREGDRPESVHIILDGLAARYKAMPNGKRQITALLVPGDFCDLHVAILSRMDHSIVTLAPSTIVRLSRASVLELTHRHPRITHALWWSSLVDEGILREWMVNIGRRDAEERMAHLFCELLVRLQNVGLVENDTYAFPVTQSELADILGLTSVHANRTLQTLRAQGLIELAKRRLHIPDVPRLKAHCNFDASYLHLVPRDSQP